jgi:hypothetical protein
LLFMWGCTPDLVPVDTRFPIDRMSVVSVEHSYSAADNQVLTVCVMVEQNEGVPGNVLSVRCLIYNHIYSMYGLLRNTLFVLAARLSKQWP